jgi:hypothetical protein
MIDKTLADYIKRVTEQSNQDNSKVWNNRNTWNEPELSKDDYLVYPEDDGTDSKRNPYGRH